MTERELHGPVDFLLVEFPAGSTKGPVAGALGDLTARSVVAIYDIMLIAKGTDGVATRLDVGEDRNGFSAFAGAESGLFDDADFDQAAAAMEPDTEALLLAYENLWAVPFVAAALQSGGRAIASERIPAQVLMDALDSADEQAEG